MKTFFIISENLVIFCLLFFSIPLHPQEKPGTLIETDEFLSIFKQSNIDSELKISKSKYKISEKDGWYYASGQSEAEIKNNEALNFFIKEKNVKMAIEAFEKVLNKFPMFLPARLNSGRLYFLNDKYEKSLYHYKQALRFYSKHYKVHEAIAKVYEKLNNFNLAEKHYRAAFKYNRANVQPLSYLIKMFANRQRFSEARDIFRYAQNINGSHNHLLTAAGFLYFKQKKYYDALLFFDAVQIKKDYDKIFHYYKAETCLRLNLNDKAFLEYEKLLLYPETLKEHKISESYINRILGKLK
ncbi:MAG: tetratricopeptide repeat protein [Spirochaetia bacterium]|nr:tetratricopeptide repeat protein [Spirochaetia bacterium]